MENIQKPTDHSKIDELTEMLSIYKARVEALEEENANQKARIAELEGKLAAVIAANTDIATDASQTEAGPVDAKLDGQNKTESTAKQNQGVKRKWLSDEVDKKSAKRKISNVQPKKICEVLKERILHQDLPTFETKKAPVNAKEIHCIVDALLILKRSHYFRKLNEAGRSVFIALVLGLVVANTIPSAIIEPQYRLRKGKSGQIIPDWVVKRNSRIILVVEAKAKDVNDGINQHIRQLYETYKENCSDAKEWKAFHGIVTTANEWVFIKAMFNGEECKIMRSIRSPWTLPLNDENLSRDQLMPKLYGLTEQLAWFLSEEALSAQG
jgi:hypothetical protein